MLSTVEFRIFLNIFLTRLGKISMKITSIINTTYFNGVQQEQKETFLDKFHSCAKNSADLTDTILVPRTIFKGYLGIMTGTTLVTLGGLINRVKHPKLFKGTMGAGLLASLYGTYAFVRPFIIKDTPGVATKK